MILISLAHKRINAELGTPCVDETWYKREAYYIWRHPYVKVVRHGIRIETGQDHIDGSNLALFVNEIGATMEDVQIMVDEDYDTNDTEQPLLVLYVYHPKVPWSILRRKHKKEGQK